MAMVNNTSESLLHFKQKKVEKHQKEVVNNK